MATRANFTAGRYFLSLDGTPCGFLKSVSGGRVSADVVTALAGPAGFAHKHLGNLAYEPYAIQVGFAMEEPVYEWIAAAWRGRYDRRDGSIVVAGPDLSIRSEREFLSAILTETLVPACDGTVDEPGYLTLRVEPSVTRAKQKVAGKLPKPPAKGEQKKWLRSNFRLEIGDLDCSRVARVDAFAVKSRTAAEDVREYRQQVKEPGAPDFADLRITLPEGSAESWQEWFDKFVIRGHCTDADEKNGRLVFLGTNLKEELASIRFTNLGIFRFGPNEAGAADGQIDEVVAELYCERMEFEAGP